ncbi:hypothetical protein AAVH_24122, partial [Aphelenchoides avenae]
MSRFLIAFVVLSGIVATAYAAKSCVSDASCGKEQKCKGRVCVSAKCSFDGQCPRGYECRLSKCVNKDKKCRNVGECGPGKKCYDSKCMGYREAQCEQAKGYCKNFKTNFGSYAPCVHLPNGIRQVVYQNCKKWYLCLDNGYSKCTFHNYAAAQCNAYVPS